MRRKRKNKRVQLPDPKYGDFLIAKCINHLMSDGKKSTARAVMYDALEEIKKTQKDTDPVALFTAAVNNVGPMVEVKSRRVGGANYQVPREVRGDRRITLAFRWIITASRAKKGKPMAKKLAEELILASKNEGAAIKKKLDTHRMAEANKAFAHFAW
ncbi:MAG: 30S ribosomal protein S7 [Candidatus Ryanbacteria bacterium RIFCSPHIGHO2_12_FULL_47_12b]|uniref:Small ribosomal subunit protein uS7 n=2 Tax=Candidatus Ryaniibacteriota TaxID=1817914 RepID=A0A1G2H797_9BACT|nr:MAG: 30S ribosomal protein S7 [Parcubacteria group bacterium GW2011_GWA2_47_10b]OGZ46564.1 MAG: 30S ribosomal protein S7 [Candidatus Ryanbacteria bacterium RIFCSPHIGHO2_01_FULL_48_80]OGZ48274.1 MAG: 30S ribosomal protein S7 [Candidatus Ryanbacteria bacterium RIFCSPHIGHO2_02_FULL_47_25]OGZ52275.1 MAG: 30S ribosomal protein S7 [Candidatus Ryanbacteria bacterium RIFCSPHIGHO2_12_FULL_47_12b]OGZ52958.1 MAG: 30S ribosomal protein S7 [Candidatus Ryanbacteria bacterium RIFCSPLOWO2_01_FULL_47_79]OGZ